MQLNGFIPFDINVPCSMFCSVVINVNLLKPFQDAACWLIEKVSFMFINNHASGRKKNN